MVNSHLKLRRYNELMTRKRYKGTLILPKGNHPEPHELETVAVLISHGYDISFITPVRIAGQKTPDITMAGHDWEMKTPMGHSKTTISNALKRGAKQSKYLIIDLRKTKIEDSQAEKEIRTSMSKTKSLQRVIIIDKQSHLVDIA